MSDIRIRFRHLQCFLTIAQLRSVGAAADALAITQPALSKTLRELEDALGVKLFLRDKKGMMLTRFGDVFLQHAAASIASLQQGIDSIKLAGNTGGLAVAVGVLPNVAASVMPKVVHLFKQTAPNTNVRIVMGSNSHLLDQLRLGELDLVLGRLAQPEYMIGLSFEQLYFEPLVLAVRSGHALLATPRFRLKMISDYPWMLPHYGTIIRMETDRFLLAQGITPSNDIVETTSISFGRSYLLQSDAIWFTPRGAAVPDIENGSIALLPLASGSMEGPVGITMRADTIAAPSAALMMQSIRDAVLQ
ncbi:pca operon transcription factor PcaQ [Pseudorhodoplanes sinuspersici]|uniref:Pca operon transcription factor PcaQ n=1 Tax=Pseudorhodoplanes sinuspersici TaxID=1235591 RepID=A0A1W6ZMG9_9HYPH|nr:pca operon transcription factor PcaQ [Pseudorhodoplanes sinuspersici]ARP98561.1 pca operon transcription factor PcaQ [Pseudorhodoplanes sinuspersici]RKE69865.1 LysR family pca operon transcriptional activator [Pseudorhodoplanes sinuspersici]